MAKNTVQSVEPNIADLVNGWLKSYKVDLHSQRKWQHSCSQLLCGSVAENHRDHSLRSDYLPL